MNAYFQKEVYIPAFLPTEEEKPGKFIPIRTRIAFDKASGEFIFDARPPRFGPSSQNFSLKYEEILAAMAAFAISIGRLGRSFPVAEDVAVGRKGQKANFLSLDLDSLKKGIVNFFSKEKEIWWLKILNFEAKRIEDFIILEEDEAEKLRLEAKEVLRSFQPISKKDGIWKFSFEKEDVAFAPNTEWGFWAIENAYRDNPRWYRVSYEVKNNAALDIMWRDEDATAPRKVGPGVDFYYGGKRRDPLASLF